ncbi:metal-binding protein [Clostridium cochlearium]|jgi:hypothetical protein|uniref:Putative metal-binding protein n=1 Tax=Clostridium cochlearium TaxID=1494 RepID=A0A239YY17_CLOCO|nr:metal-binding protein [Clostridium cochlearium]MBU5269979.1 metal-binding protein [Clostridium cochlearium]MCR1972481.1 metal-binding protein [Clostridium cochlearium]NMA57160.1 metal-binding protein [Clostridium cochlearium]NME96556.1 metal-binding protein [Clostridium cochlearium]SDL39965.1 hypothetical protein SAMN05216497_12829 [Clostridium cochlearium]
MIITDIMKYIESEYKIISQTPCEVCGGHFFADYLDIDIVEGIPHDICNCICSKCGHEKIFQFYAPFVEDESLDKFNLN